MLDDDEVNFIFVKFSFIVQKTCIVKQCKPNGLGDMQISIKVSLDHKHFVFFVDILQIIFGLDPTTGYQCNCVSYCS